MTNREILIEARKIISQLSPYLRDAMSVILNKTEEILNINESLRAEVARLNEERDFWKNAHKVDTRRMNAKIDELQGGK